MYVCFSDMFLHDRLWYKLISFIRTPCETKIQWLALLWYLLLNGDMELHLQYLSGMPVKLKPNSQYYLLCAECISVAVLSEKKTNHICGSAVSPGISWIGKLVNIINHLKTKYFKKNTTLFQDYTRSLTYKQYTTLITEEHRTVLVKHHFQIRHLENFDH